jgi:hypothetical protein
MRDQNLIRLLNPPKTTPQTEKPVQTETIRRRGELDDIDYDLIFTQKSTTTQTEEFNPYLNTTYEIPFTPQVTTPARQMFSPGQTQRQIFSPSQTMTPQPLYQSGQQMRSTQVFGQITQPMQNFTSMFEQFRSNLI